MPGAGIKNISVAAETFLPSLHVLVTSRPAVYSTGSSHSSFCCCSVRCVRVLPVAAAAVAADHSRVRPGLHRYDEVHRKPAGGPVQSPGGDQQGEGTGGLCLWKDPEASWTLGFSEEKFAPAGTQLLSTTFKAKAKYIFQVISTNERQKMVLIYFRW